MPKKLTAAARRWDSNGDGFVEEDDYAVAASRLAALSGFADDTPEYGGIHQALMAGWELMRQFDTDGDGRVSAEECLGGFETRPADPEKYDLVIVNPSTGIFDLAAEIRTAFEHLDFDAVGSISEEQFVQLVGQFYRSDDPDVPGTRLFGAVMPVAAPR